MPSRRVWLLLLLAIVLRLLTQGWDSGLYTPHPDERQVAFVSEKVADFFDDPGFYAYGSLHFRAVRATTAVLGEARAYQGLLVGGRALSLVASLGALLVGWFLAHRAWGRRTGELALLLAALLPLDLQQSHYATVEAHHALWVMAALAGCYWLARTSGAVAAVAAGAAAGASLAVKVASLPLLLPLALAVVMARRRPGAARLPELVGTVAAAACLVFWLGQPWALTGAQPPAIAIGLALLAVVLSRAARARRGGLARAAAMGSWLAVLALAALVTATVLAPAALPSLQSVVETVGVPLNPAYLKGVGEQAAMVTGKGDLPYIRVYRDTLPVLYSLRELARWGMGPLLLLAALGGVVAGGWRLLRRPERWLGRVGTPEAVLLALALAWLVPTAIRFATFEVKYLRYFEPLVVAAVMVAAWALLRLPAPWRRPAVVVTIAGTALCAGMYLWAFASPHPHRTAAEWLGPMVAADDVVAFEHWDETVSLPNVARIDLPSYDLPDDEGKVRRWAEALESSDWVVLTSNRVRRTVLVNRERFPRTGRLYRLLLSGEAGFEPLAKIERAPRLFGLERAVQEADESFLNYDFPRVVVLRRTGVVDVDALVERTARPLPFLESLDAAAVERAFVEPLERVTPAPRLAGQATQLAAWLAVLLGLAAASWALLLPLLRSWPDAGVGLALVTGWVVPAWLMWLLAEGGLWRTGAATATWIFLAVLAAGGVAAWLRRRLIAQLLRTRSREAQLVAAVAAAVFLLFLVARAFNPAIFWGEKPMDFSFLNAFLRASSWPPGEPWMAGMPLHYYYFGQVLSSFPILVSGAHPAVGYNLMAASIPALGAALLAPLGLALARRRRLAVAALLPLLVLLTGNLAWPRLLELARSGHWFDLWWATSRVVPGFAIDEYPLWTALFSDLHGHFIALPVLLLTLLWGWLVVTLPGWRWLMAAAMCAVAAAVLVATNPWDIFVVAATLAVGTVAAARQPVRGLLRLGVAGAASVAAGLPYVVELLAGIGAGAGGRGLFLTDGDFAPAWAVALHFGVFLLPLLVLAVALVATRRGWLPVLLLAVAGIAAGLVMHSSAAAFALAAAVVLGAIALRTDDRPARLLWALASLAMVAVAACERFTLIDRMNTLFKIYNGVWVLLAVALGGLLLAGRGWRRRLLLAVWLPLQAVALVNLPLGLAQGWLEPRVASPGPTLDGQAFLAGADPQTWFLVRALEGMARPGEVVVEAAKIAYAEYTRIAMHTGQPTVVGWPWHLEQRGQPREEVDARYRDLAELYSGADPRLQRALLDRYRARWVVLADVERRAYGLDDDDPFALVPGVVRIAESKGAVVYLVGDAGAAAPLPAAAIDRELPPELRPLATVPVIQSETVRDLAIDAGGGTAVLLDGSLFELDALGRPAASPGAPPCQVSSVARHGGVTWIACPDGGVWLRDGRLFRPLGRVEGATRLTAGHELWAWGRGGLWQRGAGDAWRRVSGDPVAAAAASGPTVATSDGREVWTWRGELRRRVGGPLPGVRALAWQGSALWALADGGVYRSGGAVLPWRRVLEGLAGVSAIAGSEERLWLVLGGGLVVERSRERCGSPWQGPSAGGELAQPRGLALSPDGWFAVGDTGHHRVVWYTPAGTCLDTFGVKGSVAGAFQEPTGLALAADGTLAVADTWNGRVQLLLPDGSVQVVGAELYGPRGVLWLDDGSLLVADTGNRALLRFAPPRWAREEVIRFPGPVVGLAAVQGLVAVALPTEGQVALVDVTRGVEVRRLAVPGWQAGDQQEGYLAVLPSGDLLASAPTPGELWRLDPSGAREPVRLPATLPGVTGLLVLPDGDLLAAQTTEHRLVRVAIR